MVVGYFLRNSGSWVGWNFSFIVWDFGFSVFVRLFLYLYGGDGISVYLLFGSMRLWV